MKIYLNDEKTCVDQYPQMIFCEGWRVMTETIVIPSSFKSYVFQY